MQAGRQQETPKATAGPSEAGSRMPPSQVLERIEQTRVTQREAEAELAVLVDHAVGLGLAWPEIAARLGVSRQAARQQYQRRHGHRGQPSEPDGRAHPRPGGKV